MSSALYLLTYLTTLLCAVLPLRAYARVRRRLLLWSGLCFAGLTLANLFTVADLVVFPSIGFFTYRLASTAVAMLLLLYGLVWESQ